MPKLKSQILQMSGNERKKKIRIQFIIFGFFLQIEFHPYFLNKCITGLFR